jgi:hypothetical protein
MTLRWVPGWNGLTEPEAVSYVAAVEAADEQELEFGVARAINDFVAGCKQDKIWDAIKASCILAGARTLDGALVPLVGTAPTKNGTEAGWNYNRETGLKGNGTDNYLNSNRNNQDDPQSNKHLSVYQTEEETRDIPRSAISAPSCELLTTPTTRITRINDGSGGLATSFSAGLWGASRNLITSKQVRYAGVTTVYSTAATTYVDNDIGVFCRYATPTSLSDARLAFYSIGESLDLAALDTRVSNLITAIGAAIP